MSDDQVSIRAFRAEADFEAMFAITRAIVSGPPYEAARRELAEYPGKRVVARVAASAGGEIVGFCAATFPYWNDVAMIDYLVVAPARRCRGLGTALVRDVERELGAVGARRVCVQTIAWNVDAVRFYERLGYVVRARMPGYFDEKHELIWLDRGL